MSKSNVTELDEHISFIKKWFEAFFDSKNATIESLREVQIKRNERNIKDPEELRLANQFVQSDRFVEKCRSWKYAGFILDISSPLLADEVHRKIQEIIKIYPVEEVDWFLLGGSTTKWYYRFKH